MLDSTTQSRASLTSLDAWVNPTTVLEVHGLRLLANIPAPAALAVEPDSVIAKRPPPSDLPQQV